MKLEFVLIYRWKWSYRLNVVYLVILILGDKEGLELEVSRYFLRFMREGLGNFVKVMIFVILGLEL